MRGKLWMTVWAAGAAGMLWFAGGCEFMEQETAAAPAPDADGGGNGNAAPGGSGAIDLGRVVWLHTNVSNWPVTASLSGVQFSGGMIRMDYDMKHVWPTRHIAGTAVNANPWIFVNRDGTWYAATWEWFRPGQTSKPMSVVHGGKIGSAPLGGFRPVSGETYGWMVSSPARASVRSVNERSQVVMARWP